ncbi:MAG: type II toxin-antitoxin system VapC family toxin [Nitrospirae bacterium]|nr:type II toxin-antitoxin system VapC family toxin [Nitrospirota bacterium]MBF0554076.1 type II toxin-antitoxin system VapC family toxin [Nitrospirota bacterium]
MIFADTSALLALFNPNDLFHASALKWFESNRPILVMTDYIVDELLSLALRRGKKQFALEISNKVRELFSANINNITKEDFNEAWDVFNRNLNEGWSFTDCTSYVFIKRTGIKTAFAFDKHFEDFQIVCRQPDI